MRVLVIVLAGFAIIGCKTHEYPSVNEIDLTGKVNTEKIANLSEVANNISYIPLETNDSCVIGQVQKLLIRGEFILVFDGLLKNILLFSEQGKFIRKISSLGKGPFEYSGIQFITMNASGDRIYIGTFDRKIKVFDISGNLKQVINLDSFADEMALLDKSVILTYPYPYKLAVNNYTFREINFQGEVTGQFLRQFNRFVRSQDRILYSKCYTIADTICFWEKYCDTIYAISQNKTIKARWVFKLPEPASGKEKYNIVVSDEYNSGLNLYGFVESDNYFYLTTVLNRMRNFVRFNKKTKEIVKIIPGKSLQSYGYNNDLDGGYPFWPFMFFEKCMYDIVEPDVLIRNFASNSSLDKSNCVYPNKKQQLRELVESLNENSNPIIIRVELNSN